MSHKLYLINQVKYDVSQMALFIYSVKNDLSQIASVDYLGKK